MKKNSFVLAILLLSCSAFLSGQSRGIEFYHYNSDNVRLLESILQYSVNPLSNTNLNILGQSSWEDRLNFNQETRRSMLGSSLTYGMNRLSHTLLMDYESYFDSSDLEPTAYINKNGKMGYQLFWSPLDSLVLSLQAHGLIRNEQDRYLQDNYRNSNGYQLSSNSSYRYEGSSVSAGIRGYVDAKEMNWESYRTVTAAADFNAESERFIWDSGMDINHRTDDIYTISHYSDEDRSIYEKHDEQKRQGISIYGRAQYMASPKLVLSFGENYREKRIRLKENTIRNNGEFNNDLDLALNYEIMPHLNMEISANHNLAIKDFNIDQNTRHIENRVLSATTGWEYSPRDSLFTALGVSLQRTSFPSNEYWDNDLRTQSARLGWKHYYHDYLRLSNWFNYSMRDDIYMNALLSANNHSLESFSFIPEAEILFGDRLALVQSYQVRTDYTNYHYKNARTDKLYRQLSCRYNLIFDSYPYVARAGDEHWITLPYRGNSGSAFLCDIGFSYEENQYGEKMGEFYDIRSKNRIYLAELTIKHDIDTFYYSLAPRYRWGTWTEYSITAGTYWSFNDGSYLELSLSPISEDLKEIDWRSSINLSLVF